MFHKIKFGPKETAVINLGVLILEIFLYITEGFEMNKLLKTLSYYTSFNQSMVVIYQIWQITEGLIYKRSSIQLKKFSTFLLFQCFCVMSGFVLIYFISPNAIISKKHPINEYILWTFHLGNFVYMLFVLILSDGLIIPDNNKISGAGLITSSLYIFIVILNLFTSGRLPYPFLKKLQHWQGLTLIIMFIVIINLAFQLLCIAAIKQKKIKEKD